METAKQLELAVTFAAELAKQLITVAAGTLVLTVTLVEKFRTAKSPRGDSWLIGAWGLLLFSILTGFWALMALTGLLAPTDGTPLHQIGFSARFPAALQAISFAVGVLSFMLYGLVNLRNRPR